MVSYDEIVELIIINSEKRFHADIQTRFLGIEKNNLKDKFIEMFVNMSDIGMPPYDILIHFTKTYEDKIQL